MAHFEIKNLSFSYPASGGALALDNINLEIKHGEYITICGRSGSGKTTLLKHLKSILAPHGERKGLILFNGKPLDDADQRQQASQIGYVMQDPDSQIVTDKVWHELAFGLESLGTEQKVMRLRVAEMASYFGIQSWFHKDVSKLSGGQKQLLNLASIMAMQPSVIILDEPTSQLDPIAAADFLNTVKKINAEMGTTIIITEHRLEDIFHGSDRVIVMEDGKIIADEPPKKLGAKLKAEGSNMFTAMPTPVQIFYGVNEESCLGQDYQNCPLTAREGRSWISDLFPEAADPSNDAKLEYRSIEDDLYEEPEDAVIEVKEIWMRYDKKSEDILRGINLKVGAGDFHAIVGGNGTGKSTLLRCICGINRPYRGKIKTSAKASMLPQDPQNLFVKKTVLEELQEMTGDETAINDVIEICQLKKVLGTHPYDLSGGEQQRAALAKVLLTDPEILLLDEPTKGLDNFFKIQFAEILNNLRSRGVTIVMVSHDVEFCARYASTVSMLFDGEIITTNTANGFFAGNSFYTTAANKMSRHLFTNAVNAEDVVELCINNLKR
ncbi:MAG: ATP-binding cassette domain-containing protein [Firmicutes bacterium]|nr:ATP-binding cassette domain-containing protein [Bacillota bacterium]